jgi:hypothetical protein
MVPSAKGSKSIAVEIEVSAKGVSLSRLDCRQKVAATMFAALVPQKENTNKRTYIDLKKRIFRHSSPG